MTERRIVLYSAEDGYWVIEYPSLPGCISQGKTREEAIALCIESLKAHGDPIPEDTYRSFVVSI